MNLPKHDPRLRPAVLAHSAKQHTIAYKKKYGGMEGSLCLAGLRCLAKCHIFSFSDKMPYLRPAAHFLSWKIYQLTRE